jgi:mannose-6-phosphate isomerase-like protein (cupin superfamily)
MNDIAFLGSSLTKKPWGSEYLVCTSPAAALWCLALNHKASTSFHCHPLKRTGYVVVDGEVHIEFLSSARVLKAGEFINFRPGLFHKTTALTPRAMVLEIESPNLKGDLLRLEDSSGRTSSAIEAPDDGADALPLAESFASIFNDGATAKIFGMKISLLHFRSLDELKIAPDSKGFMMVLEGIFSTNTTYLLDEPQRLLGPGDVISVVNLFRMKHVIDLGALNITSILFEAA